MHHISAACRHGLVALARRQLLYWQYRAVVIERNASIVEKIAVAREIEAYKQQIRALEASACPVALEDIAIHWNGDFPNKCKAKKVSGPCYEVDRYGKRVEAEALPAEAAE